MLTPPLPPGIHFFWRLQTGDQIYQASPNRKRLEFWGAALVTRWFKSWPFLSLSWRSRFKPLSSGHVNSPNHPKKVTFSQNCQVCIFFFGLPVSLHTNSQFPNKKSANEGVRDGNPPGNTRKMEALEGVRDGNPPGNTRKTAPRRPKKKWQKNTRRNTGERYLRGNRTFICTWFFRLFFFEQIEEYR